MKKSATKKEAEILVAVGQRLMEIGPPGKHCLFQDGLNASFMCDGWVMVSITVKGRKRTAVYEQSMPLFLACLDLKNRKPLRTPSIKRKH